jgi:hypothetical protein
MKINVSPKGRNVGYRGKPKKKIDPNTDPVIQASLKYVRTASQMEDSTERTINQIEELRKDTLRKAEY